jgi:thiol-disulfide isomerase/thioredoxin
MKQTLLHKTALFIFSIAALGVASLHAETPGSWDEIVQKATTANKPILLEFTGSDWCPPCMMMNKTVFSTPEFQKFAESDLVFVKLDFPRKKELPATEKQRNEALAQKFGVEGFPTMVILDPKGQEVARKVGGMSGGAEAFIQWVKSSPKGS